MPFPIQIVLILREIALFYTNFAYKFSSLWSKVEGHYSANTFQEMNKIFKKGRIFLIWIIFIWISCEGYLDNFLLRVSKARPHSSIYFLQLCLGMTYKSVLVFTSQVWYCKLMSTTCFKKDTAHLLHPTWQASWHLIFDALYFY